MKPSDNRTGQPPKGGGLSVRDNWTLSGQTVQSKLTVFGYEGERRRG